jgi:hypothetical protein
MLLLMSFGVSRRDVMESMRVFAAEVMPHFAEPAQERMSGMAAITA